MRRLLGLRHDEGHLRLQAMHGMCEAIHGHHQAANCILQAIHLGRDLNADIVYRVFDWPLVLVEREETTTREHDQHTVQATWRLTSHV